ncbi:MAG: ABC transporter permease [Eubacteriales bacterium]|nr:ABC transporter permease [Eubacteriales bacterium]
MFAVYRRELRSYFITPIGYIFAGMFLAVSGLLFSFTILQTNNSGDYTYAGMYEYFLYLLFVFSILIPLLTMKLLSEEKKQKTEQLLMTSPISLTGIIMAKYCAALTIFAGTLGVNFFNFLLLLKYGSPNMTIVMSNILGLFLIGAAFIAVGVFLSSLTENQLVAAVSSIAVEVALLLVGILVNKIELTFFRVFLRWFSVLDRYDPFTGGYFDIAAIIYFISFTGVFLFLTIRVYEKRRWS